MKRALFAVVAALLAAGSIQVSAQENDGVSPSVEKLLLSGWKFCKGANEGAQDPGFDDSKWENVTIPHDWAISGPFDKEIDKQVVAIEQNGETVPTEKTGRSGSLPWIGEGWYRTTVDIPAGFSHAELQFDGAMSEPRVYLDGELVGSWEYGYNTFAIDITGALPRDRSAEGRIMPGKHTLAVHLQNVEESSRWYPGAGLYRPVRLLMSQSIAVKTWGIFARTTALYGIDETHTTASEALLNVTTELRVDRQPATSDGTYPDLHVRHTLVDAQGKEVASARMTILSVNATNQVLRIKDAHLWSPEHPVLYTLVTEVLEGDKVLDRQKTKTGIREALYTKDGFILNGEHRKFKGVCLHHDLGPLGAAFNKAAFRRQVALLKEIGCDAIRTSHNMPAPWQMDICDEMGMLVMAESLDMWMWAKCKNGYARFFEQWWERDFTNLVLVHRNHPSIVMWSIGNEISEQKHELGLVYTRKIQNLIHSLDPTRPCTMGLDRGDKAVWSGVMQTLDVAGINYHLARYHFDYMHAPQGCILGSETSSTVSSRGEYKFPVVEYHHKSFEDGQVSSYDVHACQWSNLPDDDWMWQDKAPWTMGEFVWTGFDYLGEPTPYDEYWPSRSSYFGIYDLAGLPKDRVYLYRVHWAPEKETLHVLPHWNWAGREGQVTPVFVYTNYPEAELFINGKSQGRLRKQDVSLDDYRNDMVNFTTSWGETVQFANPDAPADKNRLNRYRLRWMDTVYQPGEIKVVAYDAQGNAAAEKVVRTAGKPHHIELAADRCALTSTPVDASGAVLDTPDMAFVTVRVLDKDGNLCPDAANQLNFKVSGASARFNSACNGDATSLEVFTAPTMKAFHGELVVVVEATALAGESVLTVTGKGLKSASIKLSIL